MTRRLVALATAALMIAAVGTAYAATVEGPVVKKEDSYITVKGKDGQEVRIRLSSSSTTITKGGKPISRDEVKVGDNVKATYDEKDDRKTASEVTVQ